MSLFENRSVSFEDIVSSGWAYALTLLLIGDVIGEMGKPLEVLIPSFSDNPVRVVYLMIVSMFMGMVVFYRYKINSDYKRRQKARKNKQDNKKEKSQLSENDFESRPINS